MFVSKKDEVRQFLCRSFNTPIESLSPIEKIARYWIDQHREYHRYLKDVDVACAMEFLPEQGETNPFLHLSMHLSLSEQISIDQPRGIRQVALDLVAKKGEHEAQHTMMDALAEMIWQAQRTQTVFDEMFYLEHLRSLV